MNTTFRIPLLLVFVFVCRIVVGQQYNFTNLSVSEGLAQSQVYAILEDSRGYLWMATQGGGLSRYDGTSFKNYTEKEGLLSNFVTDLEEDETGRIFIATSKGLNIFDGKEMQAFCLDDLCSISIQKLCKTQNGEVLIASSDGLYLYSKEQVLQSYKLQNHHLQTVFESDVGTIWTSSRDSLYLIENGQVAVQVMENNCSQDITSIVQDDSSIVWIGTYGGGLCSYKDGVFKGVNWHNDLRSARILSLYYENGNLWVATIDDGIAKCSIDKKTCLFLREEDGLANNNVRSVEKDVLGNMWIGTSGGGVSKYSGEEFLTYNRTNGLNGNYIYAVASAGAQSVLLGNSGLGVQQIDGNQISQLTSNTNLSKSKIKALLVDSDSLIWCGSEGNGVFVVKQDSVVKHLKPSNQTISGAWINQIIEDETGAIWIATVDGGITKIQKESDASFTYESYKGRRVANNNVVALATDKQNRIWYGTRYGGVSYITNGKPEVIYDSQHGLPSDNFRCMLIDSSNYLWLGSVNDGIAYADLNADSMQFKFLTVQDGLASNNIYQLSLDAKQNVWVGSQKGLNKISLDENRFVMDINHFSIEEGFVGVETNQNASCVDSEGNLWFGTVNGLTKYTPGNAVKNSIPPKLSIQDVSLFYASIEKTPYAKMLNSWNQFSEKVTFPYKQNHLSFDFIGINLSNPSKVRYQWMLEGFDQDWSPISAKTSATYSNLPPGEYVFKVKASNEDLVWSGESSYPFAVAIPFWKQWYFVVGMLLLAVGLISIVVYNRIDRIRQEAALTGEKIALEQKAMQLQMNPHFVFNSLNSIQGLIAENNNKDARIQLAKFSKLMRAILENSLSVKIPLDVEIETLKKYLELEQAIQIAPFKYTIDLLGDFDASFVEIPSMLLQPFVENAILHGVKTKGSEGVIRLSFAVREELLECVIQDNGIGRVAAEKLREKQKPFHISTALEVTQKRLNYLSKNANALRIVDLYDEKNNAIGTKIEVFIPLS